MLELNDAKEAKKIVDNALLIANEDYDGREESDDEPNANIVLGDDENDYKKIFEDKKFFFCKIVI
ncbi:unnamed protein product [Meloidogyne enterolobii]|uniref:Uncharacterized protein n=1 Tax=Meloidogyne enterolobii TaxID=390850 RepID=A0ACB0YNF3_MELEN